MRIEPPPSLAWAIGTMPAATAAALPPDEPPGVRSSVPRVARRAVAPRLGDGEDPELGRVGLAHGDEARVEQRRTTAPSNRRREVAEQVGAKGQRPAGPGRADVLDRDRHAGERALVAGRDRVGRRSAPVGVDEDERVEAAVQRLDALQRGLDQLAGGDSPARTRAASSLAGRNSRSVAVASVMAGA